MRLRNCPVESHKLGTVRMISVALIILVLSEEKCLKVKWERGKDAAAKYILVVIPMKNQKYLDLKHNKMLWQKILLALTACLENIEVFLKPLSIRRPQSAQLCLHMWIRTLGSTPGCRNLVHLH